MWSVSVGRPSWFARSMVQGHGGLSSCQWPLAARAPGRSSLQERPTSAKKAAPKAASLLGAVLRAHGTPTLIVSDYCGARVVLRKWPTTSSIASSSFERPTNSIPRRNKLPWLPPRNSVFGSLRLT